MSKIKMSAKPQPAGTVEDPFLFSFNIYLDEVEQDGVYVGYLVESQKDDGEWSDWDGVGSFPDPESAFVALQKAQKDFIKRDKMHQQRQWERAHPIKQQAQLVQYKITKGTTDKQIAKMAAEMSASRDRIAGISKAPKFKYEPPNLDGLWRVTKRTMTYTTEVVEAPVVKEEEVSK